MSLTHSAWRDSLYDRFTTASKNYFRIRNRHKPGKLPRKNTKTRNQIADDLWLARQAFWRAWYEFPEVRALGPKGAYVEARKVSGYRKDAA